MATPPNLTPIPKDAWELRCIFNYSLLMARVAFGELTAVPKNKPRASNRSGDPPGTKQQMFSYRDKNNSEVATVHFYHVNGNLRSEPDPKTVTVGDKRYVIHPEDRDANPEKRLPVGKLQDAYKCYRRLRCCLFGPVDSVALSE